MTSSPDEPAGAGPTRRRSGLHAPLHAVVVGLGLASGPVAAQPIPAIIARPDSLAVAPDVPSVLPVLHNDTFPNVFALTFFGLTKPSHGNVFVQLGSLVYQPAPGYAGTDTFRYCIQAPSVGNSCAIVSLLVPGPSVPVPAASPLALAGLSGVLGWLGMRGRRRR
jgi:hypothetical protein